MNDKKLEKCFAILGVNDYISNINQNGEIMKAKYYKREGTPGNYKYYYTKEEYQQAKGNKKQSSKTFGPQMTEKRLEEGTPENEQYKKQLRSSAEWNKKVKQQEEKVRKEKEGKQKVYNVEWTKVEGVDVKRIGDSNFVAAPVSGKKNSRRFDIIDLNDRSDIVTQVSKEEVNQWLINKYKVEEENK